MESRVKTPEQADTTEQNLVTAKRKGRWKGWQLVGDWIAAHPHWFSLGVFVLATIAFTWPLASNLNGALFDLGDPADSSWRLGSMAYQLLHDPFHLYQSLTLYPVPNVLTLDELLTGNALLTAPLIWLTANPVLAFNVLVFGSFALSGFATYLLARHLTGSFGAGIVAGIIFAFSPWHYAQHGHLGIGATEWMVFALYFLLLFLEQTASRSRRSLYLALFTLCFALQVLVAGYLAYFATIIVGLYLMYYFLFESGWLTRFFRFMRSSLARPLLARLHRKAAEPSPVATTAPAIKQLGWQLVGLTLAAGIAFLVILPFIWPFVETQRQYTFDRPLSEVRRFSASPNGLLLVPEQSWLTHLKFLHKQSGERALYPGLIATLLAGLGLVLGGRLQQHKRRWIFALIGLVGLILSLGPYLNMDEVGTKPTNIPLPYLWFYYHVPGFDALRVPYRFGVIMMLGLAICAAYGVVALQQLRWGFSPRKARWAGGIAIGAMLLAGGEFYAPGLPMQAVGIGDTTPTVYRWLASASATPIVPSNALLLELPMNASNPVNTYPLYALYNLQYRRPLLNGSANIVPPGYTRLFNEMKDFPSVRSLDVIEGLKVQFLIVHPNDLTSNQRKTLDTELKTANRLEIVKNFGEALLVRVKPDARFTGLLRKMPPGSQLLLSDESGNIQSRGLYTTALSGIFGSQYQYFSPYQTIYNPQVRSSQPHRVYDFAVLYKNTSSIESGYSNTNLIFSNETIEVYARPPGLEAYFNFEINGQPGLYKAFSANHPLHLNVTSNNVSSSNETDQPVPSFNINNLQSLSMLLAAPQPQDVLIQYGRQQQTVHLETGFYRYYLNITIPQTFVLSVKGPGNVYLLQARLYSNSPSRFSTPQRLTGGNELIWQVENTLEDGSSAVVDTTLQEYSRDKPARLANVSLAIDIYSNSGTNSATARHEFGKWRLNVPETALNTTQTVQVKLDLQKQQAIAFVNGTATNIYNLPLSDLDGNYQAVVSLLEGETNFHAINTYTFSLSHLAGSPVITNFEASPTTALLLLPSTAPATK